MPKIKELRLSHKESTTLFYSLQDFVITLNEHQSTHCLTKYERGCRMYAWDIIEVLKQLNANGLPVNLTVDAQTLSFINTAITLFIERNDKNISLFAAKIGHEAAIENFTLHISLNNQAMGLLKRIVNLYNQLL